MNPRVLTVKAPPAATSRWIFFHHAGGSVGAYVRFQKYLPADVAFYVVELPHRGSDSEGGLSWEEWRRHWRENPWPGPPVPAVFFGHSMGALLAYDALRVSPYSGSAVLVVSGFQAPRRNGLSLKVKLSALSDDHLEKGLADMGTLPPEIKDRPELLRAFLPAIRRDLRFLEAYPGFGDQAPLGAPILIYGASRDPFASFAGLEAWSALTANVSRLRMFEGGHFYLFADSAAWVRCLVEDLANLGYLARR